MLQKIAEKRKPITILLACVLLVLWLLYLIFGGEKDKTIILILTVILPIVAYGFVRLMLKTIKAPQRILHFFVWFFFIIGMLGAVMMIVRFISGFPNTLSPTLGACMGTITASLAEAKIHKENEHNPF